jgi:hypothetical protein
MFKQKHVLQDLTPGLGGYHGKPINLPPLKTLGYKHLEKVINAFDNLPQSAKMIVSMDEIFMTTIEEARKLLEE